MSAITPWHLCSVDGWEGADYWRHAFAMFWIYVGMWSQATEDDIARLRATHPHNFGG